MRPPAYAGFKKRRPPSASLRSLSGGGAIAPTPPERPPFSGGRPPGSPLPGWGKGGGNPTAPGHRRSLRPSELGKSGCGLASARGASAPYKHTRASARGASARIALGPRGASCSEDSPSHRRRGRRLLRLDMRTLAHVCAPRLTWASVRTTALPARSRTRRPAPVRLGSFRFRQSARSPSLASGCLALGNARKLADLGRRCLQKRSGSEIRAD